MNRPRSRSRPVTAKAALRGVLKKLGLTAGLSRRNIVQLWPKIVDPTVAKHARAEKVTGNTLHVAVDSSVWMYELAAIKDLLIQKVNARLEKGASPITDIRFSQRSWAQDRAEPPTASRTEPPLPPLEPAEQRIIEKILEPVKDEELKAVIRRVLEKDRNLKLRRDSGSSGPGPRG